ncbi:bifunctional DNA-formamidopyrimidine glycosylase/DNA-(apurinic or apyrimidinic site) lyase [Leeia oryzae]|uniref:bifunctional DNA-formamidopyrimidine glycosylase/DNA-(apurinic or apyrimidinic site) lyase n=1 Tax=Leeia oryzae TaxID=356662 RepID=UPI0003746F12|nr:bifunctional DNA-formamidopyrimidine glycosylase/DNA-(apurinic or apyrimidinic site) lyase [Leeia oryzae]
MPELPEVETTKRGILPHIQGRQVTRVIVRQARLRWPVPELLADYMVGRVLKAVERRAKYLLFDLGAGWLMCHLGMSGSLRVLSEPMPEKKHDHIDIEFDGGADAGGVTLRYHDPRRFGCMLWIPDDWREHALLKGLGPEPLSDSFTAQALQSALKGRKQPVKQVIMDQQVVVGVGNIYASESLFHAGIHPLTPAGQLDFSACERLVSCIKATLESALQSGGSTLRDYLNSNGETGYFQLQLYVYDQAGKPCRVCGTPVSTLKIGQRSSFFCENCQLS